MAIEEHPGWKEFPLEIGQAVRADQINALWFAISERGAPLGFAPIEGEFGIFDTEEPFEFLRYPGGDRRCLVKGGGQSDLRHSDYSAIRAVVITIAEGYVNPEIATDESGDQTDPPFIKWTISDLCKELNIGGPVPVGTGPPPENGDFSLTRIPDRGNQVIGKDENGGDVKFNDFFGDAEFSGGAQKGDPTFVEHLNELYVIIKKLTHIPFVSAIRDSEVRIVRGSDRGSPFDFPDEEDDFLGQWDGFRSQAIANAAFSNAGPTLIGAGGTSSNARARAIGTSDDITLPADTFTEEVSYAASSEAQLSILPVPVFPGQTELFGENNDLISPYEYGEIRGWTNISFANFTLSVPGDSSSGAPPNECPVISAIAVSDITKAEDNPVGVSDLQQGSQIFDFALTLGIPAAGPQTGEDQFLAEVDLASVSHMLPTADLGVDPADADIDDLDAALGLWFAGSFDGYGGDYSELGPPGNLPGEQRFFDAQRQFRFTEIFGFLELLGFIHGDRGRDPLLPCFPSGQDCDEEEESS